MSKEKPNWSDKELSFGRVKAREVSLMANNFSLMLKSGLSLSEALDILSEQASPKLKKIIIKIEEKINAGNNLSDAIKLFPAVFDAKFVAAVEIGERSGTLEENLFNLSNELEKQAELKEKIKSAMFYPAIILVLSIVLALVLSFVVFPRIIPLFKGLDVELPLSTRTLIAFTEIIENHGVLVFGSLVFFGIFIFWLWRQKFIHPFSHKLCLILPILSDLTRNKNMSEIMRILGTMIKSGLEIDRALIIAAESCQNFYYKKILYQANRCVLQGEKLSSLFKKYPKYFPRIAVSMISVGEKSGRLEEEFISLSDIYAKQVDNTVKRLSVVIEPILLLAIGLLVGGLALSIITPIYKITGNVY
jgi:type IV pilus assembly protein PilC